MQITEVRSHIVLKKVLHSGLVVQINIFFFFVDGTTSTNGKQ